MVLEAKILIKTQPLSLSIKMSGLLRIGICHQECIELVEQWFGQFKHWSYSDLDIMIKMNVIPFRTTRRNDNIC